MQYRAVRLIVRLAVLRHARVRLEHTSLGKMNMSRWMARSGCALILDAHDSHDVPIFIEEHHVELTGVPPGQTAALHSLDVRVSTDRSHSRAKRFWSLIPGRQPTDREGHLYASWPRSFWLPAKSPHARARMRQLPERR